MCWPVSKRLKIHLTIVFGLLCFIESHGQKIKSIESKYYKVAANRNNGSTDSMTYVETILVSYSSKGNIKEELVIGRYNPEKSKKQLFYTKNRLFKEKYYTDGDLYHEIFYARDKKGHLISKSSIRASNRQKYVVAYINNQFGKCVKEINYDHEGGILGTKEIVYNSEKQKIETMSSRANGEFDSHHNFKYDANGNMVEETSFTKNGGTKYIWKYEYDEANRKIKAFDGYNGKIDNYGLFYYDATGNTIKEVFTGTREYTMEYAYKYDANKNWIEMKITRNGSLEQLITRNITYF